MVFGVGVYRQMAFIQVAVHGLPPPQDVQIPLVAGRIDALYRQIVLAYEDIDARPLRVVILLAHIEHMRADNLRDIVENVRQTLRIVLLVDICDIILLRTLTLGIAHIVDVKAKGFGEVVKAIQFQLAFQPEHHSLSLNLIILIIQKFSEKVKVFAIFLAVFPLFRILWK